MNPGSLLITVVYAGLLAWGFSVGARQIYRGYRAPQELLNPLFSNRFAIRLFTLHIIVVSANGPIASPFAPLSAYGPAPLLQSALIAVPSGAN